MEIGSEQKLLALLLDKYSEYKGAFAFSRLKALISQDPTAAFLELERFVEANKLTLGKEIAVAAATVSIDQIRNLISQKNVGK